MNLDLKNEFIEKWRKYFGQVELPLAYFYTDEEGCGDLVRPPAGKHQCMMTPLNKARKGIDVVFDVDSFGCGGGKRFAGYGSDSLRENFNYFLSYGIEGKLEGERYRKTPQIVEELMKTPSGYDAPEKFLVFKRWDRLKENDDPQVVVFYAKPDVLSGIFTLCGYEETRRESVIAPFGAGCQTIISFPMLETARENPRSVLGMFDVSARPFVPKDTLCLSIPMAKFARMIVDMDESFLITPSWDKIRSRI